MKTAHLAVGIVLVILGVLLGIFSFFLLGGSCVEDPLFAQILNLPTCDQLFTQIFAVGAGGLLFLIIGIVVLATGREKQIPQVATAVQPVAQAPIQKVCPSCGTIYGPEAQFCQKDATPLQPYT